MIFFLYPVGTVGCDTDFNNTNNNNPLDCYTAIGTVYTVQYVQDDNDIIGVKDITLCVVTMMTAAIYEWNVDKTAGNNSSDTITMTTHIYSSPSDRASSSSSSSSSS